MQQEAIAAEKAKIAAEMAKISDGEAVMAHNNKVLSTVLPMRSRQADEGSTPEPRDQLEQAVLDAESERYTAAQKGHIQSFVQKENLTNTSKVATKAKTSPAQPTDAQKKKPFDLLEHQAKVATTERPVYAQKKNGVQMSAEAKKAAKARRREQLKQKRIQNEKQIAFLKQEEKELAAKEAMLEKTSKAEIESLKKKESAETKALNEQIQKERAAIAEQKKEFQAKLAKQSQEDSEKSQALVE